MRMVRGQKEMKTKGKNSSAVVKGKLGTVRKGKDDGAAKTKVAKKKKEDGK